MKKALLVVLIILLVFVGALLAAPVFVDWNAYRREVAAAIVQATGREVTLAGDLDVSILPLPRLTVRRIRIASVDGAVDPDLLQIGELRMELAVVPLLMGKFAVRSLSLIDPVLTLETTTDGRRSWEFAPVEAPRAPNRLGAAITVETIFITNGTLAWRTAGGQRTQIEAVEATLALDGQTLAASLKGAARFGSVPFRVLASMDKPGSEGPAHFSATIDVDSGTGRLAATGQVDRKSWMAEGAIRATATDANALNLTLTGANADAVAIPPWNVVVEGNFSTDSVGVTIRDLEFAYGEIGGTGQIRFVLDEVPALNAKLAIGAVNLDRIAAATAGGEPAGQRSDSLHLLSGLFKFERSLAADIDIAIKAVRWRDGVIRDIGADISFGSHGLAVERLAMRLPGGTDVTLSGMERRDDPGAPLEGDLAVISDNLRSTLIWAGTASERLPSDRLRSLSLTSRVAVTPKSVYLANIAARLDATRMTGAATIMRQSRPSFGLRLALDHIDLDAYLPESIGLDAEADKGIGIVFPAAGLFDANVVLSAETLTLGRKTVSLVSLDARLFDGDVLLRKMSIGDLGGATFTATGKITDATGAATGDLDLAVQAGDSERFIRLLDLDTGQIASRIGGFRLDAHVSGTADRAAVSGKLELAGGEVSASGTLTSLGGNATLELALDVSHTDADRVLNLLAPERPYGGIGAMAATFDLASSANSVKIKNLDATLGAMAVAGRVDLAFDGPRPSAVAVLSAPFLDMDRLLPPPTGNREAVSLPAPRGSARWSRQPIDLSALRSLDLDLSLRSDTVVRGTIRLGELDLHAALVEGVLRMDRLTGNLFGGSFKASARIDAMASSPAYTASVSGRDVTARNALAAIAGIDRVDGPLAFSLALSATGRTTYDLVSTASGNGTLSGTLQARRHGSEPIPAGAAGDALAALLKAFSSAPAMLSGEFRITDGTVQAAGLHLDGGDVRALISGVADISGWRIDSSTTVLRGRDGNETTELLVEMSGPLDAPAINLSGPAAVGDEDEAPAPDAAPVTPVEPVAPASAFGQNPP